MIDTLSVPSMFGIILVLSVFLSTKTGAQILNSVEFKFREEQERGSYVGNVGTASRLATSLSENEFSRLKFNLPDSKYFRIDEKSGSLISAATIDREEVCDNQVICKLNCDIIVYTSISAGSYDILKVISVLVEIQDINDNIPEFPSGTVALSIPESNDIEQVLRTRSAIDKDTGENSIKQYRFQDFTDTFRLTVHKNPDGSSFLGIVVKEKLDRETKDFYQVTVIAVDGGFPQRTGSVLINITVTDINDNVPEFPQNSYNETMQENMALNFPIMKVKASDKDAGKNSEISYQFSSRVSNKIRQKFYIDEHTGEIFAQSNIDYEGDTLFQFIVEAFDHGTPMHTTRTNVNLYVIDMNDNAPQIVINLPPKGAEVLENEPVGKFIAHVSVMDSDSGSNGDVGCVMDDEDFSLSKFSEHVSNRYKVILARVLDFEQNTYHRVSITCSDNGTPSLSNSTSFVVSVVDTNDNTPVFTESKYDVNVMENQEGDDEILEVTARDWDSGDYGKVLYFLDDTFKSIFSIHQSTGVVKVLRTLDREYIPQYELYVIARDNGLERLSSSVLVVVTVDDENDEPPRFPKPVFFLDVLENQPTGTSLGVASAIDTDSPANARMEYTILKEGNDYIHFSIDPDSGVITNQIVFDREEKEQYHFLVRVVDPNKPIFFSTCNFTVRVLDVNDHAPVIHISPEENATYFIQHPASAGSIITTILADDGDETLPRLTFLIEKGDPERLFDLDRYTGSLTLARTITFRDFKTYDLVIIVQDSGDPPRFDKKEFSIKVNGTMMSASEGALSDHIVIVIILVCVTVVLTVVIVATILLVRKLDRKRRRKRANQEVSEDKMLQLNRNEMFVNIPLNHSEDSNKFMKKGRQLNKNEVFTSVPLNYTDDSDTFLHKSRLSVASAATYGHVDMNMPVQGDVQDGVRHPPLDEECRLIEILKRRNEDDDAVSDGSDDTDPSDSGRGGSEDETNQRVSGLDHSANKLYPQNYHHRAHPSSDNRNKHQPYHQQQFPHRKPASHMPGSSSRGKPTRYSGNSSHLMQNSLTSDVDSDSSGNRASKSRSDQDRSMRTFNKVPPPEESSVRLLKGTTSFRPSQAPTDHSPNRLGGMNDDTRSNVQSTHEQSSKRPQLSTSGAYNNKNRPTNQSSSRTNAPTSRQYKYTDRAYPLSSSMSSPTPQPDDDDKTTTSGSYTVNPEDLRHELHALVLHDTVV